MNGKQSNNLIKHTLIYSPGIIIPAFINVAIFALIARKLSISKFGIYSLILATANLIIAISSQWIQQSVLRLKNEYTKKYGDDIFYTQVTMILFELSGVLILLGSILMGIDYFICRFSNFIGFIIIYAIDEIWTNNILVMWQAELRVVKNSLFRVFRAIIKLSIVLGWYFSTLNSIESILYLVICGQIFVLIFMIMGINFNLRYIYTKIFFKENIELIQSFLKYGLPILGWFVAAQLLSVTDRYMLAFLEDNQVVGIYSAHYNIASQALALLATPLLTSAHPIIINKYEKNNSIPEIQKLISSSSSLFIYVMLPIVLFISMYSADFVAIMIGEKYLAGHHLLVIFAIGMFFWKISMYGHKAYELQKHTKKMFFLAISCFIINVVLNIVLIPLFSYIGAAIATLTSFLLYPVLVYIQSFNTFKWDILNRTNIKIVLANLFAISALYIFKNYIFMINGIISIITGSICFIFILLCALFIVNDEVTKSIKEKILGEK